MSGRGRPGRSAEGRKAAGLADEVDAKRVAHGDVEFRRDSHDIERLED
jgi:hypothetical protein